ncbi:putative ARM repeat superfamily protein [Paratrimastix pyriformis]|uniref:ARM repeat superfamily protein n=1 Tax=Paratrimastix pyriformis TaxID=342808 RepID=A0ABQ8UY07_9EUKA|nr:putative ARM repeat superfamily protein [Paratrimastix pyriformis]
MIRFDDLFKGSPAPVNKPTLPTKPAPVTVKAEPQLPMPLPASTAPFVRPDLQEEEEAPLPVPGQKHARPAPTPEEIQLREEEEEARLRRILQQVNEEEPAEAQEVDDREIRRLAMVLEKRFAKNQELRLKFAEDPQKFVESELELDEAIKKLLVLTEYPHLYPVLLETGALRTLLGLLVHDNVDLAVEVVALLNDLTDPDVVVAEPAAACIVPALEEAALPALIDVLKRFSDDDPDQAKGVHNVLNIVENLVEVRPSLVDLLGTRTGLLDFLVGRLRAKEAEVTPNRLYCSEILAIMVQGSEVNQRRVGVNPGIDLLLRIIARYRKRDVATEVEVELLENMFNVVCACLLIDENRSRFLQADGVDLMIILVSQHKYIRAPAFRCLSFALNQSPDNCTRFVERAGLKPLFAAFMQKIKLTSKRLRKGPRTEIEDDARDDHHLLADPVLSGLPRQRLMAKFRESGFEKIDRLIELHRAYATRIDQAAARLNEQARADDDDDETTAGADPDLLLSTRMEEGLATLQMADLTLGAIIQEGDPEMKERIRVQLRQYGMTTGDIKRVLEEFVELTADTISAEAQKRWVTTLIAAL